MQKDGAALLAEGMAHSPSFRRLVNRIEQSDVIVYIDVRPDMRPGVGGVAPVPRRECDRIAFCGFS